MDRRWIAIGAALAAAGVALGAFGAHGLKGRVDPSMVATWETAAHYHQLHALALIVIGALPSVRGKEWAARLFFGGVLVFSGSLYVYVLTSMKAFAIITPLGGLAMIAGWVALAVAFGRRE